MSLLPSKEEQSSSPRYLPGGLHKHESMESETTRLLSRQTSYSSYPYEVRAGQNVPFSDISSEDGSVRRYASPMISRHNSGIYPASSRAGLYKDAETSAHSKPAPRILVSKHGTSVTSKYAHYVGGLQKEDESSHHSDPESLLAHLQRTEQSTIECDKQVALLVWRLFAHPHHDHQHPKTIPELAPEKRGKRHRHPGLWTINQFRHWWKSSRLLVRLSGSYGWCQDALNWSFMAAIDVTRKKDARRALKQVKRLGRGGSNRVFLQNVHPFTRTLRIFIAIARAWEARVDNRFYEVGIAEGMAFMGNRCFRYYARHLSDWMTAYIALPISGRFIAPYLEQQSRPVIVIMGLVRAILPFMSSYMGSAFGRQVTFAAYRAANYRWKPVQRILQFHEARGSYQDIEGDEALLALARRISVAIGHDQDPVTNREALQKLGFEIVGAGSGGLSYYRSRCKDDISRILTLYITPYGPGILNEMPRYIILARRFRPYYTLNMWTESDASFFDAAIPPEAEIQGFVYSGAYFTNQEWAALKNRFTEELFSYNNACKIMGTPRAHIDSTKLQHNEIAFPPTDLVTLKAFIRTGHTGKKRRKEKKRWRQVQAGVQQVVDAVKKYKSKGVAPNGVILYMDGLDCSGKSSTGGLICDALEKSGYTVEMVQYNRPPTDEEKKRPWMDRFATPLDDDKDDKTYASLVWDRGPAGDFVYGNLHKLSLAEKLARYEEFRTFDLECQQRGILFCKLLFVTDKDSIAETLGKRLAHKQIAQDLQTWLDANSFPHFRQGLEEVNAHIDPSDFSAFNMYKENLANFCEFARNTDNVGHVGIQKKMSIGYSNPWHVVCTYKRHPARLALMSAFRHQLFDFAVAPVTRSKVLDFTTEFFGVDKEDEPVLRPAPKEIVEAREHGISIKALFLSAILGLLVYAYAYQTWNFKIEDIT